MQSIEQYFKTHVTAAPHPASAACPAGSCCVKTSALPEQQAAQTQCTPAAAPTASTKSVCGLATAQAKNRVDYNFISAREGQLQTNGYVSTRTSEYWNQVTHGEWTAAVQNLNDFGDAYPTRRALEANLIQGDINSGKLPASEGICK
jgi:hypothetical protein